MPLSKRLRRAIGAGMICAAALTVAIVSTPSLSLPSWGVLQAINPAKAPKSLGLIMLARTAMVRSQRRITSNGPVFVSSSTQNRGAVSSNMTVTAPTSISDGNLLILFVVNIHDLSAAATCSGFTQIYHDDTTAPTVTILKKTASSESGNYSVASSTSGQAAVHMLNYTGGVGSEDVIGTVARASSATATASSITATVAGVLLAFFTSSSLPKTITTPPSGMTQRAFNSSGYNLATYELTPSPSGATGSKSLVWSGSNNVSAILMQIK